MHRTEEITVNDEGGKQSKLYTAYHLMDPRASHAHAAVLHRGELKYGRDNWRHISAEQHINRAIAHLNTVLEYIRERDHQYLPRKYPVKHLPEDDLAHALCRVHMALAMEINYHGFHPEHYDPKYHEPEATSTKCEPLRNSIDGRSSILGAEAEHTGERGAGTIGNKERWYNNIRPQEAQRSGSPGVE